MSEKHNPGVYGGSRVGYLEHEVENWLRERVRVGSGQPVAAPMPPPEFLKIIPVKEAERRVGVTRVCLWRWERQNRFPARVRLIEPETVDAANSSGKSGDAGVQRTPRLARRSSAE